MSNASMQQLYQQAVFLCLKGRRHPHALASARRLMAEPWFDWEQLVGTATAHRVSSLVYDALNGTGVFPPHVDVALSTAYNRTAFLNLFFLHQLSDQLNRLKSLGVDVIVLKGASLAITVYRTIGLRPMVDVDLLVHREQAPTLLRVLKESGFEQGLEPQPGAALEFENELALYKPGLEPIRFDIHWSLFDSHYYQNTLSLDWYWQSSRTRLWNGSPFPVLSPEAQLIHLCGHLALHHAQAPGLLWFNDLDEIIWANKDEISWDLLLKKACEMNLVLPVRNYLSQLAGEWEAPIPDAVVEQLRALPVSADEQRLYRWHTAKHEGSLVSRVLPDLYELPGGRRKLRFIWAKLAPSADYLRKRYERPKPYPVIFLYLYHFGTGLGAGLKVILQGAAGIMKRVFQVDRGG